jgi:hypothetical protein
MNYLVKIVEGKDLEPKDLLNRSSDPFCVLKFGGNTYKTKSNIYFV